MLDPVSPSPARRGRRPLAGALVVIGLVALAVLAWLVVQWVMAPPLSGDRYHDFGIVPLVESPTYTDHVFRLQNTSGQPVTIRRAVPSCGCTEVLSFEKSVPAGGYVEVPVRMKLKRSVREKSNVTLTFENAPPMKLHVEAFGRRVNPFIIEPRDLRMRPGQVRPVMIAMETWDDSPMETPRIEPPPGISIKTQPWKRVRIGNDAKGIPSLERMNLEVTVPEDAEQMNVAIRVVFDDQVVSIPLRVTTPLERERLEEEDQGGETRTLNPLRRGSLKGSLEEEDPGDPGANQSSIPSHQSGVARAG